MFRQDKTIWMTWTNGEKKSTGCHNGHNDVLTLVYLHEPPFHLPCELSLGIKNLIGSLLL